MAEKTPDLTKLSTIRLLALFKAVRKCGSCAIIGTYALDCIHKHPSIEALREECSRRGHIAKEKS